MFEHPSENEPTNTRDIHSPDADICMNTTTIIQLDPFDAVAYQPRPILEAERADVAP
jgi:hypothetical protein